MIKVKANLKVKKTNETVRISTEWGLDLVRILFFREIQYF